MILFCRNKKQLHKYRKILNYQLGNISLSIKGNYRLFKVDKQFIDFIGYRFHRHYTTIRKRNYIKMNEAIKTFRLTRDNELSLVSYYGLIKNSDSYKFYKNKFKSISYIKQFIPIPIKV